MKRRIAVLFACFNLLSSCYKNHLYVQQEWIDPEYLASSHVKTPDPRQANPPKGQKLLVAWDFPRSLFVQPLTVVATVRLWDNTQKVLTYPMERKRDYTSFYFPNNEPDTDRRILTYLVQVVSQDGTVLETWKHQFWTELIDVDKKSLR